MLGAIIGDIVGSPYEFDFNNLKSTDFPLVTEMSDYTDDSIMTIAVAEALMEGYGDKKKTRELLISKMRKFGRFYPNAGYGARFMDWLCSEDDKPYNSYGNGSAMRVSSVGWMFEDLEMTEEYAELSAEITHNHPEGIKGAKSVAGAIYLARNGADKSEIKKYIEENYGYDLDRTLDEIRPNCHHVESCQESVPEAIIAFLESAGFEDAIRKAVSIGGDSDTIASITGSIAEAYYSVPEHLKMIVFNKLSDDLLTVIDRWYALMLQRKAERFRYKKALQYAKKMHRGQKRMGGEDYIIHPVAVSKILYKKFYPIEYCIAGLFHDLLEDTEAKESDILRLGGAEVLNAVKLVTKEKGYDMQEYIARIKSNPMAMAVKAADRLNNLRTADIADEKFKEKYDAETIKWFQGFEGWEEDINKALKGLEDSME